MWDGCCCLGGGTEKLIVGGVGLDVVLLGFGREASEDGAVDCFGKPAVGVLGGCRGVVCLLLGVVFERHGLQV